MRLWYRLDENNEVQPCRDALEAAAAMTVLEKAGRRWVGKDQIGRRHVSTVFLALDHNFGSGVVPVLFETAIGSGTGWDIIDRYQTYDEAKTGHEKVVERLRNGLSPIQDT